MLTETLTTGGGLSASEAALVGGMAGGLFVTILTIGLIFYVLMVIAGWKIFEKAGEKGWKALIPLYNTYIFYKIVGMKKWFWALLISSLVISFITSAMGQGTQIQQVDLSTGAGILAFILMIALCIFAFVASVIYAIRTSKVFGHGITFAVGLFFLSSIFMLVLGFGKSKYNKKLAKSWNK